MTRTKSGVPWLWLRIEFSAGIFELVGVGDAKGVFSAEFSAKAPAEVVRAVAKAVAWARLASLPLVEFFWGVEGVGCSWDKNKNG